MVKTDYINSAKVKVQQLKETKEGLQLIKLQEQDYILEERRENKIKDDKYKKKEFQKFIR